MTANVIIYKKYNYFISQIVVNPQMIGDSTHVIHD